jgi:hypothetical protein
MQLEKLKQLADQAVINPHYDFKDRQNYQANAAKSFERIPDAQKLKVQESWNKYLAIVRNHAES